MGAADIIAVAVILAVVIGISVYIYRAKKRGEHCIGCPYSGQCGNKGCAEHKNK